MQVNISLEIERNFVCGDYLISHVILCYFAVTKDYLPILIEIDCESKDQNYISTSLHQTYTIIWHLAMLLYFIYCLQILQLLRIISKQIQVRTNNFWTLTKTILLHETLKMHWRKNLSIEIYKPNFKFQFITIIDISSYVWQIRARSIVEYIVSFFTYCGIQYIIDFFILFKHRPVPEFLVRNN